MTDSVLRQEEMDDIKRVVKDDEIQFGDVVGVHRMDGLYDHYGIYTGNGGMIHYADPSGDWGNNIVVHRTTIDAFKGGQNLFLLSILTNSSKNTDSQSLI